MRKLSSPIRNYPPRKCFEVRKIYPVARSGQIFVPSSDQAAGRFLMYPCISTFLFHGISGIQAARNHGGNIYRNISRGEHRRIPETHKKRDVASY